MKDDIKSKYGISYKSNIKFKNYTNEKGKWNDKDSGLFGCHDTEEEEVGVYNQSIERFNSHLKNEFVKDYNGL